MGRVLRMCTGIQVPNEQSTLKGTLLRLTVKARDGIQGIGFGDGT